MAVCAVYVAPVLLPFAQDKVTVISFVVVAMLLTVKELVTSTLPVLPGGKKPG